MVAASGIFQSLDGLVQQWGNQNLPFRKTRTTTCAILGLRMIETTTLFYNVLFFQNNSAS